MRAELAEKLISNCGPIAAFAHRCVIVLLATSAVLVTSSITNARDPSGDNASSRETQTDAARRLPMKQLSREAQQLVNDVIDHPSFFRRMPTQTIDCDPELFRFIVRYPEVLVNIWDVMGITKVQIKRTGPYTFTADDSVGTICKCDLVYGNDQVHVYYGSGAYKGSMAPRQITGRCVCVLHTTTTQSSGGSPLVTGTMDVFLKLDNLGADLLTRTLGPFVGKTADYNFIESAKFISQISQVCESNPDGAQALISKLDKVTPEVRDDFSRLAMKIGSASERRIEAQHLSSLGPTRTELPVRQTVPVAEFQSRSASTLPQQLQMQVQQENAQLQSGSSRSKAANIVKTTDDPLQLTFSDAGSEIKSDPKYSDYLSDDAAPTVVPSRPAALKSQGTVAPLKPGVYMRR